MFLPTETSGVFELKIESLTGAGGQDVFFRVCLKHAQEVIDPEPPCTYGTMISNILPADPASLEGSEPLRVPFHFKWPGTFSLILEARNAESLESAGLESAEKQNNLISRVATGRQLRVGEDWSQDVHFGQRGHLRYSYRAVCDQHYHGDACAAYCRPRNDTFGHFTCQRDGRRQCLDGWDGEYCAQPICASGCSAEHGFCQAPGECACHQGWRGERCDQCERHPGCLHGTCQQPWQCHCQEGWGGLYCDQDLNYCTNHKPCQNGASCTNTGQGSYTCACRPGFSGKDCQTEDKACDSAPCRNGGRCQDSPSGYVCTCPLGFSGPDCAAGAALTCADRPCFNRGVCVTGTAAGYTCRCPTGYAGSNCEMKDSPCNSAPCANGGQCVELGAGAVTCRCRPGFAGPLCESNVDECAGNPCRNGGTCADGVADFTCTCALGFAGKDCSLRSNPCERFPCRNGGRCFAHFSGPVCQCPPDFMGARCEYGAEPRETASAPAPPRGAFAAALAAACVLGALTLGLLTAAAVFVLRQVRRGKRLAALSASVKNDLEAVNNRPPGKVRNKEAALAGAESERGALLKNKMDADCNLAKERQDKVSREKCDTSAALRAVSSLQEIGSQPRSVVPEQLERCVFATEV
ncbi:delta-like protein C isoform X2 [Stigmatopora argus]